MPGGNSQYNLLLFEDKAKEELVHIRAQKDYKLHALHDSTINIDHDQTEVVGHDESFTIGNDRSKSIGHDETGYPFLMSAYIRGVGSQQESVIEKSKARLKDDIEDAKRHLENYRRYVNRGYGGGHRGLNARKQIPLLEAKITDMQNHPEKYIVPTNAETVLGGGLGTGCFERLQGMLWHIQTGVKLFNDEKKHFPKNIELDIFGFSRGAAEARHFVNMLKQEGNWWKINQHYDNNKITIRTLNLFDTVGSFYTPGEDIDPGLTYYIDPGWVSGHITHFIADDEYRYNFDGQLIGSFNDKDYPVDRILGKIQEYVLLGAHSDIGGGYSTNLQHGIANNDLSKVYLNKMYDLCKGYGVPFKEKPEGNNWDIPEKVTHYIEYFDKYYKNYGNKLKIAHKKLREWQAAQGNVYDDKMVRLDVPPEAGMLGVSTMDNDTTISSSGEPNALLWESGAMTYVKALFEALGGNIAHYNDFVHKSNVFHNTYVHISHTHTLMGLAYAPFGAETGKWGTVLHRDYFIPKKEDMGALTKQSQKIQKSAIQTAMPSSGGVGIAGAYLATANTSFQHLQAIKFKAY
jgi:hypothetical protein